MAYTTVEPTGTNDEITASARTSAVHSSEDGVSNKNIIQISSYKLTEAAFSAEEEDLPTLSLVLDMALSILLARAAVVSLISHVQAYDWSRRFPRQPQVSPQRCAGLVSCESERLHPLQIWSTGERDRDTKDGDAAEKVAQGLLEALASPDKQMSIVGLTKVLSIW